MEEKAEGLSTNQNISDEAEDIHESLSIIGEESEEVDPEEETQENIDDTNQGARIMVSYHVSKCSQHLLTDEQFFPKFPRFVDKKTTPKD